MRDDLLTPLGRITKSCNQLQSETMLTMQQENMIDNIRAMSDELFGVIISVPDLTWDKARELLSFEARDKLTAMLGFAEILLDQEEGPINDKQAEIIQQIGEDSTTLLNYIGEIES